MWYKASASTPTKQVYTSLTKHHMCKFCLRTFEKKRANKDVRIEHLSRETRHMFKRDSSEISSAS